MLLEKDIYFLSCLAIESEPKHAALSEKRKVTSEHILRIPHLLDLSQLLQISGGGADLLHIFMPVMCKEQREEQVAFGAYSAAFL